MVNYILSKLKTFALLKDTTKKMKRQATGLQNIYDWRKTGF